MASDTCKFFCNVVGFFVMVIVMFSLIIVTIYHLTMISEKNEPKFIDGCENYECQNALIDVKRFMDESVDPCQDFYKYACGGYQVDHSYRLQNYKKLYSSNNQTSLFTKLAEWKIETFREWLAYNVDATCSLAEQAAAIFYRSCENKQRRGKDELPENKAMQNILNLYYPNISLFYEEYGVISAHCEEITAAYFPEAILRLVAKNEVPEERKAVLDIVQRLYDTLSNRARSFPWIDDKSWGIIKERLNKLAITLNYRAHDLHDTRGDDPIFQNLLSNFKAKSFSFNMMTIRLQPRDLEHLDLLMTMSIPYAGIYQGFNDTSLQTDEIMIPYSFWRPPFFSFSYPDVINYARFGTLISHELVHALQWFINIPPFVPGIVWTHNYELATNFNRNLYKVKAQCVSEQFENMSITSHSGKRLQINGSLTNDENVADILGFQLAFKAFQENGNFKPIPGLDKFSKEQVFFIASAQSFCEAYESPEVEEYHLEQQLKTDVQSPMFARVRGLANSEDFGKAFNCPLGSVYNPQVKCVF